MSAASKACQQLVKQHKRFVTFDIPPRCLLIPEGCLLPILHHVEDAAAQHTHSRYGVQFVSACTRRRILGQHFMKVVVAEDRETLFVLLALC